MVDSHKCSVFAEAEPDSRMLLFTREIMKKEEKIMKKESRRMKKEKIFFEKGKFFLEKGKIRMAQTCVWGLFQYKENRCQYEAEASMPQASMSALMRSSSSCEAFCSVGQGVSLSMV